MTWFLNQNGILTYLGHTSWTRRLSFNYLEESWCQMSYILRKLHSSMHFNWWNQSHSEKQFGVTKDMIFALDR